MKKVNELCRVTSLILVIHSRLLIPAIFSPYYFRLLARCPILIIPTLHWLRGHLPKSRFDRFLIQFHSHAAEIANEHIAKLPRVLL